MFVVGCDGTNLGLGLGGLWSVEFSDSLPALSEYTLWQQNAASDVTQTSASLSATLASMMPSTTGWMRFEWSVDGDPTQHCSRSRTSTPSARLTSGCSRIR